MKRNLLALILLFLTVNAVMGQRSPAPRPRRVITLPATPCSPRDFVQAVDTGNSSICRTDGSAWDGAAGPAVATVPGGATTNVQYNSSGLFGGSANFTFDSATQRVTIGPAAAFGNTAGLRVVHPTVTLGASPSHFSSIRSDLTVKATVPTAQLARGFYGYFSTDPTNTVNFGGILGVQAVSDAYGTGIHTVIVGTFGEADNSSSVTQPKTVGAWGFSGLYGTGDTTLGIGAEVGTENYGLGTVQTGYGLRVAKPQENGGTGPIANLAGIFIDEQLTGTTTNFNLVSKGATSKNLFEGDVLLDKLTASTLIGLDASKNIASLTIGAGLSFAAGTLAGSNAAADGTTKGIAAFTAADFDATSGVVSLDYTNGQTASGSAKGFLTATDWTTFNNKQSGPLTGDVTTSSAAATIASDAVTNAKLANMATATFKGRTTSGTGDPEDLTATQATALLNAMVGDSGSGGTKGLAPAPAAGDAAASKFLKADGTWAAVGSSGITTLNTLTGATQTFATATTGTDFTISSSGTAHTFSIPTLTTGISRGLITNGTQTIPGTKTFTGQVTVFGFDVSGPTTASFSNATVDFNTTSSVVKFRFSPSVQTILASSNSKYTWVNNTNVASGTEDTGICRNGAGVLEINNGTCGTFRDLKLRHLSGGAQDSHIQQSAANSDIAGTISLSAATSASKTFTTAYASAPACVISAKTDPGLLTSFWVTTTTAAVTVNASSSSTIDFTYHCIGNPN